MRRSTTWRLSPRGVDAALGGLLGGSWRQQRTSTPLGDQFDNPRGDVQDCKNAEENVEIRGNISGRGGIRTPGGLSPTPVFKTGALNHSATRPGFGGPL